jgi:hypothetical protein
VGTSNSNPGPKNPGPLLPPWTPPPLPVPDNNDGDKDNRDNGNDSEGNRDNQPPPPRNNPQPIPIPIPVPTSNFWQTARRNLGQYTRTRERSAIRKTGSNFVRAQGGSRGAVRGSAAGISTARGLGGLLSTISTSGAVQASQRFGIQYLNRSVNALINDIVNAIAPSGSYDEDAVAREAAAKTIFKLFDDYDVEGKGLETLEAMTAGDILNAVQLFLTNYINSRLMSLIGARLEQKSMTPDEAYDCERDVKDYVVEQVKLDLNSATLSSLDWSSDEGRRMTENIFEKAYNLIEVTK